MELLTFFKRASGVEDSSPSEQSLCLFVLFFVLNNTKVEMVPYDYCLFGHHHGGQNGIWVETGYTLSLFGTASNR